MIRVLLVDDDPMVCTHLRTILTAAGGIEVAAVAHDGAEAVEAAIRERPDVVLLDLAMPGVGGLAALPHLVDLHPAPRVIVLTSFDLDEHVLAAMRAGAAGYLVKSTAPEELAGLVRVAAEGSTVLSPVAAARLVAAADRPAAARARARELLGRCTEREADVLEAVGAGMTNAQISARLAVSEATVKGHVSRLMEKLGCQNRTQVALLAHQAGLVAAPDQ